MKVLFLANIPSPYRIDFFNELGKKCDLTVSFEGRSAADRDKKWKGKEAENFRPVYLKGIRYNAEQFICAGIISLIKQKWDCIIVGVYSSITSMLAIEYMNLHRIPFIISADGGFVKEEKKAKYLFKKHFISSASLWLSTGKETTGYLTHYGAKADKCRVFPFTSLLDEDIEKAKEIALNRKEELREKLNIKEKLAVISVGQFIHRKGFDTLIKCAAELDRQIGVYIIGGNPTGEYIKLKEDLNAVNVHFAGFKSKEELAEYYAAADIFAFPTREDIWGLVINEAMAYGLPVITTEQCMAGKVLVENGVNGYIVQADDVQALVAAVNNLAENPQTAQSMRKENFEKIKMYSIEKMAEKHWEIIKNVGKKNI